MAKGFLLTMRDEFRRPGQTLPEFMEELKALTQDDKDWYRRELIEAGHEIS